MAKSKLTPLQAQAEKDVKRINERINEIAKLYGTNSYSYNRYYSAVKSVLPSKYVTTSKHGIIQIARSKELYKSANTKRTKQAIQRLLGMRTAGELKKQAKKSLKALGVSKPSKGQIEERAKIIDKVNAFVSDHEDMFYLNDPEVKQLAHIRGRRKTYEELNRIIEIYEDRIGSGNAEMIDIFQGL